MADVDVHPMIWPGLAGEEDLVAGAAALAPFHIAYAKFSFAVIFMGIAERAGAGSAASAVAASLCAVAPRFAARAREIVARASSTHGSRS